MTKKLMTTASALALMVGAANVQASGSEDETSITLEGEVSTSCEVINNIGDTADVDLSTDDQQTLGSLTYRCNAVDGFTREISSDNDGQMAHESENSFNLDYKVSHGGGSGLGFSATSLESDHITGLAGSTAFANGQTGTLRFYLDDEDEPMAGDYDDTITVSVTAQ